MGIPEEGGGLRWVMRYARVHFLLLAISVEG